MATGGGKTRARGHTVQSEKTKTKEWRQKDEEERPAGRGREERGDLVRGLLVAGVEQLLQLALARDEPGVVACRAESDRSGGTGASQ